MATDTEILAELESLGTAQNRKIYARHGVNEAETPIYGVSYADLGKLKKRLKVNHDLALKLWASRNHDARVLALMIADPKQSDPTTLDTWSAESGNYPIADALAAYVRITPLAHTKADAWIESDDEWIGATGWFLISQIAMSDTTLPDTYFEALLARIERDIDNSKNYTRYAMNGALIAIGLRSDALEAQTIAAAQRIGTVVVDHGQTDCKTPAAIPYIEKTKARRAKQKQKA